MSNTAIKITREEVNHFTSHLCIDSESSIEINGHYVTGTVKTVWNDEGDIDDYVAEYTIDGEEADEYDVYQLLDESDED